MDLMKSGFYSVLPWITMAVSANAAGYLADSLIQRGTSITTVRKAMQTVHHLPCFGLQPRCNLQYHCHGFVGSSNRCDSKGRMLENRWGGVGHGMSCKAERERDRVLSGMCCFDEMRRSAGKEPSYPGSQSGRASWQWSTIS